MRSNMRQDQHRWEMERKKRLMTMQMKSIDLMMAGWLDVDKAGQGRGSRKSKWSNSLTDTNPEAKW
jgi:hypothetical protein